MSNPIVVKARLRIVKLTLHFHNSVQADLTINIRLTQKKKKRVIRMKDKYGVK